jgi:hypothetical protein
VAVVRLTILSINLTYVTNGVCISQITNLAEYNAKPLRFTELR